MSDEIIEVEPEVEVDVDENEPVFFKVKTLNLVASAARILSWVVLAAYLAMIVGNVMSLIEGMQGASFADLIKTTSPRLWMFSNLVTPILTGATFFVVLQGISSIIDALLEIDFNTREVK